MKCIPSRNRVLALAGAVAVSLSNSFVLAQCGNQPEGNCCTVESGAGCNDPECCEEVCGAVPFCCETAWTEVCRIVAQDICAVCGGEPECGDINLSNCCEPDDLPYCKDSTCCNAVCDVMPDCCVTAWTADCAAVAGTLADACPDCQPPGCGDNETGDCCEANGSPHCDDPTCCAAVCAVDPSCCEVEWTQCCADLAGTLPDDCPQCSGCANFCGRHQSHADCWCDELCSQFGDCCPDACCTCEEAACVCPDGSCNGFCGGQSADGCFCDDVCFFFSDCCHDVCEVCDLQQCESECPGGIVNAWPASGTVDARQPYDVNGGALAGLGDESNPIVIQFDPGFPACLSPCQSSDAGYCELLYEAWLPEGNSTFEIVLNRPISPGAATRFYFGSPENGDYVEYIYHPGNVNADGFTSPADILALIDDLNGVKAAPFGLYSTDIDRSGVATGADILRLIDLLNGAGVYESWNLTALPVNDGVCP